MIRDATVFTLSPRSKKIPEDITNHCISKQLQYATTKKHWERYRQDESGFSEENQAQICFKKSLSFSPVLTNNELA